jgi:N4-gp56 family major capsid protein
MASRMNIAGASSGNNDHLDNVIMEVFSQEIFFAAQANLRFESICVYRNELNVMPGNKIKFLRYNALEGDPALSETVPIETDSISTSTIEIAVGEFGKAIAVTELLLQQSVVDVLADASTLLGRHYQDKRDDLVRDTLLTAGSVLYAGDNASRADLTTVNKFDVELIRAAVETLATGLAPKFDLDAYVAFVHPHQSRYLRADPAWVNVQLYGSPENILSGEIGRIEDVRFIETTKVTKIKKNTQDIFSNGVDTGKNTSQPANADTDVYQSIVVGDYAVGLAESVPVEMRDNGVIDFGRRHELGYYGIWGTGLIEEGHALILETA